MSEHGEHCPRSGKWYVSRECREFSTDGTALGADIAHTMGTTDEAAIARMGVVDTFDAARNSLTGMDAEQADWDADE